MACAFHAFTGDGPCPWCDEAAGVVRREWTKLAHACPRCESPDRRRNELADPPYAWCGQCGARA